MLHTTNNFEDVESTVLRRGDAVVYFTASWCVPCRQIKPQFARASVIDADRDYFLVDIDETPGVVERFGIQSVPTIIAFYGLDEFRVAARTANEIVQEVSAILDSDASID
jgi:thioredoxin 1